MARLPRLSMIGTPQHIIQRGNNRQVCFASEQDIACYASWLKEYSQKYRVEIHAWVFMTNHVHLLVTPQENDAISNMMQAIGRRYVRYFNREYQRSGTLWEGRFKSCLVQTEHYFLQCQRYIELNPVRANMVADPADFVWSSYQCHGLGKVSAMHTPHAAYMALGASDKNRRSCYRDLFQMYFENEMLVDIRESANKGLVLGNAHFKDQVETRCKQRARPAKRGRPRLNKS